MDIFLNTSEKEGLPVPIMEAVSFQISVITPEVGGIGEVINNGINGFHLSEGCYPEEIAEALCRILYMDNVKCFRKMARKNGKANLMLKISVDL